MNKKEFDRIERRDVSKKDFTDAVKIIVETKPGTVPDRQPTVKERNEKWRLDRVKK